MECGGYHISKQFIFADGSALAGNNLESQAQNQFVLLDARNLYETRIGKFQATNVETLDPKIRQYSDLPSWIDEHTEKLHGKHILM